MTTFVSYLSSRQYIPFGRIPELLKCICNVSLSEGTVFNMLERVAHRLLPVYNGIKKDVLAAKVVGSDESSVKVTKPPKGVRPLPETADSLVLFREGLER